jgi:hypothetical protein
MKPPFDQPPLYNFDYSFQLAIKSSGSFRELRHQKNRLLVRTVIVELFQSISMSCVPGRKAQEKLDKAFLIGATSLDFLANPVDLLWNQVKANGSTYTLRFQLSRRWEQT